MRHSPRGVRRLWGVDRVVDQRGIADAVSELGLSIPSRTLVTKQNIGIPDANPVTKAGEAVKLPRKSVAGLIAAAEQYTL